ncbi:hypothetical protein BJ742DRAFT_765560 [Cladochytrium replicatum]|nr:hypothetical protein BJ742DRAFT_765560 [Cladochytrium replicatum]
MTDPFEWGQNQNPLDTYLMQAVPPAVERATSCHSDHIDMQEVVFRYAHETAPGRLVAIQRLGEAASIGVVDESSHLCIHPIFGPWFAFRSVILFPMIMGLSDSYREPTPRLEDLITPQEERLARQRLQFALE